MHAGPGEGVEIRRKCRNECLPFAGAHFRNLAVMERDATDQLHVEMTHVERTPTGFTYDCESFRQQLIECFTRLVAFPERLGPGAQVGVSKPLNLGLERVDLTYGPLVLLEQPVVAAAEDFPE